VVVAQEARANKRKGLLVAISVGKRRRVKPSNHRIVAVLKVMAIAQAIHQSSSSSISRCPKLRIIS
jgi:hypothetical protein